MTRAEAAYLLYPEPLRSAPLAVGPWTPLMPGR